MAWKDEWIEVTPTTTTNKQRVRKSTIGGYGKVGRSTYLYRDIFDQSESFAVAEGIETIDDLMGRNAPTGGGTGYKANQESKEVRAEGKSCANCKHYSRPNEKCVKKGLHMDDMEAIEMVCGEWKYK